VDALLGIVVRRGWVQPLVQGLLMHTKQTIFQFGKEKRKSWTLSNKGSSLGPCNGTIVNPSARHSTLKNM
jgi:hypothetical protein